ncbi:MAG: transcription initiation factor IIB [Alectoria sarmentosa]|nr:MAG: transcription initiation factor IIB [Alectoria sarmentosa]
MAAAFLGLLLRVENSVQPNSGERCIICFTAYGTLCNETGVVEWEIRLPCNHTVGSSCIATWLGPTGAANNSCPVCRFVFFPAQPRPYLEHGVIDGDQTDMADIGGYESYGYDDYPPWIDYISRFSGNTPMAPQWRFHSWDSGAENGNEEAHEEESSEDIIPEPPVQANTLRRSARLRGIAPEHPEQANIPRRSTRQQDIAPNDEEEMREEYWEEEEIAMSDVDHHSITDLQTVKAMCETYCYRLNLNSNPRAIDISQHLAGKIYVACLLAAHAPSSIAAVSVYLTSHLVGAPKSRHLVSRMSGVAAGVISRLYWSLYPVRVRAEFIDEEMLALIDRGDVETVLGFLPEV